MHPEMHANVRRYTARSTMTKVMLSFVALGAGALNALAFAPFSWWMLCMLSIGILFALWHGSSRGMATWYGFAFGLGMFGVGTSWMYISINTFGGMSPLLAGFCIFLLVVGLALFPAAAGFAQGCFNWAKSSFTHARVRQAHASRLLTMRIVFIMPSVWLFFEWLRGWVLTGFPWLTSGYAMLDTPLAGLAPLGGVYLVSIVTLMSAGALLAILIELSWGGMAMLVLLSMSWFGGWQAPNFAWTQPQGEEISVAIVQNNVPLEWKWDTYKRGKIIADYLAESARHRDADVVVMPEAALPDFLDRMPPNVLRQMAVHPADFIFGALTRQNVDGEWQHYNSIVAVGSEFGIYHKQHLVPFGEYLPVKRIFQPLMDMLQIPMSDLTQWREPQKPLKAAGNTFAASVCYEDAFPLEWHDQIPRAGVLLNVSEDAWFGDSFAPHQRLQMARFRALESERPMIRASNNGLSSAINWRGGVDVIAPQFVKTVVTAKVQPRTGVTPYVLYGNMPALIFALMLLLIGLLFGGRGSRKIHVL